MCAHVCVCGLCGCAKKYAGMRVCLVVCLLVCSCVCASMNACVYEYACVCSMYVRCESENEFECECVRVWVSACAGVCVRARVCAVVYVR